MQWYRKTGLNSQNQSTALSPVGQGGGHNLIKHWLQSCWGDDCSLVESDGPVKGLVLLWVCWAMVVVPPVPKTRDDTQAMMIQGLPPSGWGVSQWNDAILVSMVAPEERQLPQDGCSYHSWVHCENQETLPCRICLFSLISHPACSLWSWVGTGQLLKTIHC